MPDEPYQLPVPCPACKKSYWTRGRHCNECGENRHMEIERSKQSYKQFLRDGGE